LFVISHVSGFVWVGLQAILKTTCRVRKSWGRDRSGATFGQYLVRSKKLNALPYKQLDEQLD